MTLNELEIVSKISKELNLLDKFCKDECNILCKKRERKSKDKCVIKNFINYINR